MIQFTIRNSPFASLFVVCIFTPLNSNAQAIVVPQAAAYYEKDPNTVLLEHFNGSTSGTPNGSVTFPEGVFGQGVRLNDSSWVSWNLGGLAQGTVEFWGYLDTLTNAANDGAGVRFVESAYSQFYAGTFVMSVFGPLGASNQGPNANKARVSINAQPYDWFGVPTSTLELPSSAIISPTRWHHYAATWGSQGCQLYIDGTRVYSDNITKGQNPNTGWWCIGNQNGQGFNGVIDELRISKVQRVFEPASEVNFIQAFTLDYAKLIIGATYQPQSSSDMVNWTNWGSAFTATSSTYSDNSYHRTANWQKLFFRLQKQ